MSTRTAWTRLVFKVAAVTATVIIVAFGLQTLVQGFQESGTPVPAVVSIEPSYGYDFGDARVLVAFADNVFLGKVIEEVGRKGRPTSAPDIEIPQTQFAVQVLEVIKGSLPETVIVNQESGIDKDTGKLYLIDGDPLLMANETVLFAVAYEPEYDWYTLVAGPFSAIRAKDAAEANLLVARFEQAELAQFLPVPDGSPVTGDASAAGERENRHKRNKRNR